MNRLPTERPHTSTSLPDPTLVLFLVLGVWLTGTRVGRMGSQELLAAETPERIQGKTKAVFLRAVLARSNRTLGRQQAANRLQQYPIQVPNLFLRAVLTLSRARAKAKAAKNRFLI